jgi:HEAT repeat protein
MSAYNDFQRDFLNANTWAQRKDGLPLDLLDALSDTEKLTAEEELLRRVENDDPWVIQGLAHLRSARALERFPPLLKAKSGLMQVHIATAIYELSGDLSMEQIVADFTADEKNDWTVRIDAIYCLAKFRTESAQAVLHRLESDKEHLIAYNAKRAVGVKQ